MNDEDYMKLAIEESAKGNWPYGAIIVKDDKVIAKAHNTTTEDFDATAHAEVNAIRIAVKAIDNLSLSGCTLYTSSESCPMCTGAEIWANISRVVFGASIAQLIVAGQRQINTPAKSIIETGFDDIDLVGGVLADQAIAVVNAWNKGKNS